MGRITIFTVDRDLNSMRLIQGLQQRGLPYTEICLQDHPSRHGDVKKLAAGSEALPQCFFNTRRLGGVDDSLKELQRWDKSKKYKTIMSRYEAEIGTRLDPIDQKLAIPDNSSTEKSFAKFSTIPTKAAASVCLPDGTRISVADFMDKMKNSMPLKDLMYCGTLYKKSFSGATAVQILQETLRIPKEEAVRFLQYLVSLRIVDHVTFKTDIKNYKKELYRLHCHTTVNVLNSLRVWTDDVTMDGSTLINKLHELLWMVETKSTVGMYRKLDFKDAALDPDFLLFEDAVCELQRFDMKSLVSYDEKLAFALNLYSVMLRYAFIKIGISQTENQQTTFLNGTKFNVGGYVFTFQEWIDGVLRGNRKSISMTKAPFKVNDRRHGLALTKFDNRIHFALNCGGKIGSSYSTPFPHFTADRIDVQLDAAARVFFEDNCNLSIDRKGYTVRLSKWLRWYKSDFATDDRKLLEYIEPYLGGLKKSEMNCIMDHGVKSITFVDVDWARCASNCFPFENDSLTSTMKGFKALAHRFLPPKTPFNENARLRTLKSFNLLDTLPEERFDRIAQMAGDDLEAPIVLVALMDESRNWFKSANINCELPMPAPKEGPREISFCGHTINGASNQILYVENLLDDDRFADSPYVTGLGVQFYAGHPLTVDSVEDGSPVNIGTLCMYDFKPRKFTELDKLKLSKYANQVKREIMRTTNSKTNDSQESDMTDVQHDMTENATPCEELSV